jgi:phenylalanine-4-hydroxylase
MNQDQVIASIPAYLRPFCVQQDYSEYTSQDQAVWRYIMHRNMHALRQYAHPAFVSGLEKTGINIERIPDIDEMNRRLGLIGWRAVVVDGFVPPAAFMEFQEHKILVISAEMRNINNVLYTPAPDIVHEAAGHAPIIAESKYAEFLQRVGEYGSKAVFSKHDFELYEAIRYLSIIKEYPNATADEVAVAEKRMFEAMERNTNPSEAALLSRFHWWTVEYGLMGSPEDYWIYGAGILSSVGESKACLDPKVKKIPLSVQCVDYNYDITEMQPQLFVAKDFDHLLAVLEEFASTMCFRVGGSSSVQQLIDSENVGTAELNSGIQISGVFTDMEISAAEEINLIKMQGHTQFAIKNKEIHTCQDAIFPMGHIKGLDQCLSEISSSVRNTLNLIQGQSIRLEFKSAYVVTGTLIELIEHDEKLIALSLVDATVSHYDHPDQHFSTYLLPVGSHVRSAYSGSADRTTFNVYPEPSKSKTIKVDHSNEQLFLFALYQEVHQLRVRGDVMRSELEHIHLELEKYPSDWLLRLELYELAQEYHIETLSMRLKTELLELSQTSTEYHDLITTGLEMLGFYPETVEILT